MPKGSAIAAAIVPTGAYLSPPSPPLLLLLLLSSELTARLYHRIQTRDASEQ